MCFEILRGKHARTVPCPSGKCDLEGFCSLQPTSFKGSCPSCKNWAVRYWRGENWNYVKTNKTGWAVKAFTLLVPWPLGSCRGFFSAKRHWLGPRALSLGVPSVTEMFFGDLLLEHTQPRAVEAGRLLRALQCSGQPLWRYVGGRLVAKSCWSLLESRAEDGLVL